MIISIVAGKASDNIHHSFMVKILWKVSRERTYLNLIKAIYDKTTAHMILSGEKLESISPKIRNKTRIFTLTTFIQHSIGSPSHSNQTNNRYKRYPNWKRRGKTVTLCR